LLLVLTVVGVVGFLLTMLFFHSPELANNFWPPCFTYKATGLHCPGCGTTRCLYSLLHGDIPQALAYNLLFPIMLPYILWSVGRFGYYYLSDKPKPPRKAWPRWVAPVLVILIYGYAAIRNIPSEPFNYLAPHRLEANAPATE